MTLLIATLFAVFLLVVRHRSRRRLESGWTAEIVSLSYMTVAVLGLLVYTNYDFHVGGFYDYGQSIHSLYDAAVSMTWLSVAVLSGAVAGGRFTRSRAFYDSQSVGVPRTALAIAFATASIVLLAIGVGPSALVSRTDYLPVANQTALTAGNVLGSAALLLLGSTLTSSKRMGKLACVVLALVISAIFFSLASRRFAIAPLLLVLGYAITSSSRGRAAALALAGIAAFLLMPVPLELRDAPVQGFSSFTQQLARTGVDTSLYIDSVLNILVSLPLASYVAELPALHQSYLVVSINPLPSRLAGWAQVADSLRYSEFVPYSAIGELLNYGLPIAITYYFLAGVFFGAIDRTLASKRSSFFVSALFYGVTFLFAVISLQYNLRSATRLIYYAIALAGIAYFARAFYRALPRRAVSNKNLDLVE